MIRASCSSSTCRKPALTRRGVRVRQFSSARRCVRTAAALPRTCRRSPARPRARTGLRDCRPGCSPPRRSSLVGPAQVALLDREVARVHHLVAAVQFQQAAQLHHRVGVVLDAQVDQHILPGLVAAGLGLAPPAGPPTGGRGCRRLRLRPPPGPPACVRPGGPCACSKARRHGLRHRGVLHQVGLHRIALASWCPAGLGDAAGCRCGGHACRWPSTIATWRMSALLVGLQQL